MKKIIFIAFCCAWFSGAISANAQSQDSLETIPTKPYIKEPPPGSKWTVAWTYVDERDKPQATPNDGAPPTAQVRRPESVDVLYTKNMSQLNIRWSTGRPTEVFVNDENATFFSEKNNKAYLGGSDHGTLDQATGLFIDGFHGTHWIDSTGEFAGTETIDGVPCYVFTTEGSELIFSDDPEAPPLTANTPPSTAWIDQATGFPIRVQLEGHSTLDFSPVTPTTERPKLPREILDLLEKKRQRQLALEELEKHSR